MPENCAKCPCGNVQDGWCYVHDEVLEKLENGYPDITKRPDWCPMKESVYSKWIPCSERLPEIKDHHASDACLVYLTFGGITFAELREDNFGQVKWDIEREGDHLWPRKVLAWMPLPEPYER
jgi:hypothetical protein